jgi:hypothetical protein
MDFGLRIKRQDVAGSDWPVIAFSPSPLAKFSCNDDAERDVVALPDDVSKPQEAGKTTSVVLFLTPDLLCTEFSLGSQHVTVVFLLQQLYKPPCRDKFSRLRGGEHRPPSCHSFNTFDWINPRKEDKKARLFFVSRLGP